MPATVNVPFVGTMNNSGTADLQTVQQESFTFTGVANAVLSGVLSPDIIGAFEMSQEEQTSGTVVLNVGMRTDTLFKAALKAALETVTVTSADNDLRDQYAIAGASSKTLQEYIVAWCRQEIDNDLTTNTIGAAIEASEVENLTLSNFANDASGAAVSMYDGLVGLSADTRRLVATQLPSSRFPETFSDALPLIDGDMMVFRFNVNPTIVVSEKIQDLGGSTDGGAAGTAAAGAGPGVGSGYGVDQRVIELVLTKGPAPPAPAE